MKLNIFAKLWVGPYFSKDIELIEGVLRRVIKVYSFIFLINQALS